MAQAFFFIFGGFMSERISTVSTKIINDQMDVRYTTPTGVQVYTLSVPDSSNLPEAIQQQAEQSVSSSFSNGALSGVPTAKVKNTLQGISDDAIALGRANETTRILEQSNAVGNEQLTNTETAVGVFDYSKDLENAVLYPETYSSLGPISGQVASISSNSTVSNAPGGITLNERNRILDGVMVDPYKDINEAERELGQYDTIGGADLACFLIMEFVPPEQLSLDPLLQTKDMMMIEMDSVLSVSYSTIRERFPVRQMGIPNPVAITAGVRTIAGHIAFAVFTEDVLGRLRSRVKDSIASIENRFKKFTPQTAASEADKANKEAVWAKEQRSYNNFLGDSSANTVTLLDSLPPFNLLVMGTNEAGTFGQFMIKGISIVDENQYQGTQQPNIINKVSFVATDLIPMQRIRNKSQRISVHSASSIDESYSKGKYNGKINFNTEVTGSGLMDEVFRDMNLAKG